jgi:AraC-like DNA-binding protein
MTGELHRRGKVRNVTREDHSRRIALARRAATTANDCSDMARAASYFRAHFDQIFAHATGETPGSFLRRRRLDRATLALCFTRRTILEIALDAGFGSHEAFTRAFRRRHKITPSAFRSHGAGSCRLAARLGLAIAGHFRKPTTH